jgi:tetratricopeptide (TPR) repeat protein
VKPGRNDPCPCGSGKKYKHCCSNLSQTGTAMPPTGQRPKEPSANEQNQLIALHQAGRYAELEYQAGLLLQRNPNSGFGWKILSAALSAQGKDDFPALQRAASLLPQDAQVHNNLGDMLAKREALKEAELCFRHAIHTKPGYSDAYYNLGQVLIRQERYQEAIECFKEAIEIQQDNVEAHVNLATALKLQGFHDEAEARLQLALRIKPDFAEANSSLGGLFAEQGKFAEAESCYRRALAIRPDLVMPRISLVNVKKIKPDNADFQALLAIEEKFRSGALPLIQDELIALNFGLGKGFDDLGDYDRAFKHFAEGGRLKRSTFQYDARSETRMFDEIKRILDAETIQRLTGGGDPSQTPIFVLGMPRSGTTLTEQIIASHPSVHGAGELPDLLTIIQRDLAGVAYPGSLRLLDPAQLLAWSKEYLTALQRHAPETRFITDKMPQNFLAVGLIHLMLPNAKIIHVKRNPVDTCISCFTNVFAGKSIKFSYDLAELGKFYAEYIGIMEHWRNVLPIGSFLEIQYEDLVQDTEGESRRLIEYCGLEWNDACLDFHKNDRSVRTASVTQVRQPIYRSSMERWRRYEQHLGPLLEILGDLVPNREIELVAKKQQRSN